MEVDIKESVSDTSISMFKKVPRWEVRVKVSMDREEIAKFETWLNKSHQGTFLVLKCDIVIYERKSDHPLGNVTLDRLLRDLKKKGLHEFVVITDTPSERDEIRDKLIENLKLLKRNFENPPDDRPTERRITI